MPLPVLSSLESWRPVDCREDRSDIAVTGPGGRDIRAEVAEAVVTGGLGLLELRPIKVSLEDVFVRLVREENGADREDGRD